MAKRWLLSGDFADPHRQHGPDIAGSCASGGASYSVLRKVEMAAADVEKQGTGDIAVWLITAWFIWTVLFISTVISAFVMFRVDHGPWEGSNRAVLSVATIAIIASVLAWMSYEAPAFFRRRAPRLIKRPSARYFVNFLLSMFLAWSVSVLGQVCAFIGLPLAIVAPVFFGATWLLFVFHFPTKTKIIRWTGESVATRTLDSVETKKLAPVTVTAAGALRKLVSVLKTRWAVILATGGVCMFPATIIGFFLMNRLTNLETLGYFDSNISSLASVPFSAIAAGSVVLLVMGALGRREVGIAASLASSFRRLPSLIVAVALIWIVTSIGFLLLVVPGIILSVRLHVTVPALMVEEIGPLEALRRAWTLSRAHQLVIFFSGLVVWLIVLPLLVSAVLPFIDLSVGPEGNPFRDLSTGSIALASTWSWCAATVATVLPAALATVLYVQITEVGSAGETVSAAGRWPRVNDLIRVPEVRVIGPDGTMLGVLRTDEARRMARSAELDLVEVDPKANPPVCKIMDLTRFKYEEVKRRAQTRKHQTLDDEDPGTKG